MRRYAAGDRVTHEQYGDGTVTSVNERHTRIQFDSHGLRTFVSSLVILSPAASAAPVKAGPLRAKSPPRRS
jgi:hypothetical protein